MPVNIQGYRVFIASPGGLEEERKVFRETLRDYNEEDAWARGVVFWPVGWEETVGGVGRPQSIVNEELRLCDFFVMILWDRWGSLPDGPNRSRYSSGTEEEYRIAVEYCRDPGMPMRDILVFFRGVDQHRLSDPGAQLRKVLRFRRKLEQTKGLLYHTYDEVESFGRVLRKHLAQWIRDHETGRIARVKPSEMPPGLIAGGAEAPPKEAIALEQVVENGRIGEEIARAWCLTEEGRLVDAERLFAKLAVGAVNADALNAYGRFLVQLGRLGRAQVMYEEALKISEEQGAKRSSADACSGLGLIYQTRGEPDRAEEMLQKSVIVEEALGRKERTARVCAKLGLVYYRRKDLPKAEEMLKKSLGLNETLGHKRGMAHNYANLGAICYTRGDSVVASDYWKRASALFREVGLKLEAQRMQQWLNKVNLSGEQVVGQEGPTRYN